MNCDDSNYLWHLVKNYKLQFYLRDGDHNEFIPNISEYQIKFTKIIEINSWWKCNSPKLCDQLISFGFVTHGTKATYCIPFERQGNYGGKSHKYLVLHVYPRQNEGNGVPSVNFASAKDAPDAGKSRVQIFRDWGSHEKPHKDKPYFSWKNNSWQNEKYPSVDAEALLKEMLNHLEIFELYPDLYDLEPFKNFKPISLIPPTLPSTPSNILTPPTPSPSTPP